jgi:CheY-like chemotaxis protein
MMKVLIIDDEPLVRRSLKRAFEAKGHLVFEASDGKSGLQLWQKEVPNVVFLDVLMPGLSGPEVLSEINPEIRQQSFVVLISAYAGGYDLESAKSLGADHFIPKPFDDIFAIVNTTQEMLK